MAMRSEERYSGFSAPPLANFGKMAETEPMKTIAITPTAIIACKRWPLIVNWVFAQPLQGLPQWSSLQTVFLIPVDDNAAR
ncbi:MAG: hypothetical protein M0Z99_33340 [Betaproteobacteria bacterium]|nr:hypothetical protein [Betaproteobacteria bacterium]